DHTGRPRGTRSSRPSFSFLSFLLLVEPFLAPFEPDAFAAPGSVRSARAVLPLDLLDLALGTGRRLVTAGGEAALEGRGQVVGARPLLRLLPTYLLAVTLALDELQDALPVLVLVRLGVEVVRQHLDQLARHLELLIVEVLAGPGLELLERQDLARVLEGDEHGITTVEPQRTLILLVAHHPVRHALAVGPTQGRGQGEVGLRITV